MRDLLLACIIIFAILALPAGAQNESGVVLAEDMPSDLKYVDSSTLGALDVSEIDPFFETILGNGVESDSATSSEQLPSNGPPENEALSEDEASNNLNYLIISSAEELGRDSSRTGYEPENVLMDNDSEQASSEELSQTANAFDQSKAAILSQTIVPLNDKPAGLEKSKSEDVLALYRELTTNLGKNDSVPVHYSEENSPQISNLRNDLKDEALQNGYGTADHNEAANYAGRSYAYQGSSSAEKEIKAIRDQYSKSYPSFELISTFADGKDETSQSAVGILKALNSQMNKFQKPQDSKPKPKATEVPVVLPQLGPFMPSEIISEKMPYLAEFDLVGDDEEPKKYAVVVGINQYSDRKSLSASVNDADEMASLLELYGYEVIKLTDNTEIKPTKHNILDGAIKEIKLKQNRGNVVIYFSGHGEKDESGNFYLIPQNAKGDPSNYISKDELKKYIKDIKDLSLIVDACYSGELASIKEDGQMILASSDDGEPSNEIWTRSNSIFTHLLCKAIRETRETGTYEGDIPLKSSFFKAQRETIQLSRGYLLSQNPIIS